MGVAYQRYISISIAIRHSVYVLHSTSLYSGTSKKQAEGWDFPPCSHLRKDCPSSIQFSGCVGIVRLLFKSPLVWNNLI